MVTYTVTKLFVSGALAGLEVTDTLTQDESLPDPFTVGQHVTGLGSAYVVTDVTR